MRATTPKQYLPLLGRAVVLHTLERLTAHPRVSGVLVGIFAGDDYWPTLKPELARLPKLLGTYAGGSERVDTVLSGLKALEVHADADDWVLVHDAARPCLRAADLDKLINQVLGYPDGGLLAVAISDTVKRTDAASAVTETVSRSNLWRALTPQLFPLQTLRSALELAVADGVAVTDESMAVEYQGGRPRVVAGHADNIKITLAEDLELAELYLKQQEKERA
jgi:2-C-methyl-D-erythritol 4-phosphate cytidylyltransferase